MKFLNSWPNSLPCLAKIRLQGWLETHSVFHSSEMVSHWCSLNKIPLPSLLIEPPSSIYGSKCLAGMGDKFLRFQFLSILGVDTQGTGYMCLYLFWWCACFKHPMGLGPEPIWVDATLNSLTGTCRSPLGRVNFCEGFAFDLADFWWCTWAHPHWLGCTQCIPHHPSSPLVSSS